VEFGTSPRVLEEDGSVCGITLITGAIKFSTSICPFGGNATVAFCLWRLVKMLKLTDISGEMVASILGV